MQETFVIRDHCEIIKHTWSIANYERERESIYLEYTGSVNIINK